MSEYTGFLDKRGEFHARLLEIVSVEDFVDVFAELVTARIVSLKTVHEHENVNSLAVAIVEFQTLSVRIAEEANPYSRANNWSLARIAIQEWIESAREGQSDE